MTSNGANMDKDRVKIRLENKDKFCGDLWCKNYKVYIYYHWDNGIKQTMS